MKYLKSHYLHIMFIFISHLFHILGAQGPPQGPLGPKLRARPCSFGPKGPWGGPLGPQNVNKNVKQI